jgi:hypothetical protein
MRPVGPPQGVLARTAGGLVVSALALLVFTGGLVGAGPVGADPVAQPVPTPRVISAVDLEPGVWAELRGAPAVGVPPPSENITVLSAREGLEAELVATIAGLEGVLATARVRSDTVGLFGSTDADGVGRDVLAPGYRIPVTVTALDPDGYLAAMMTVTDEAGDRLGMLASGKVLLSASSASLRGVDVGGRVDLGGMPALEVVGVVDDWTARGSEFLVHLDDAESIGLGSHEALLVRHRAEGALPIAATIEGLDGRIRIWHDRENVRLVLSHVELKSRFGEFAFRSVPGQREVDIDDAFVAEHITIERMPVLGNVRCHRLVMGDLRAALDEVVGAGLEEWLAPRSFGGCFHARRIAFGRENLSRHSWGVAIDLNVDFSSSGGGPVPPDEFIAIMGRHGFRWGGDFATPDNHHYEWVGEAARVRPTRDRS